MGGRELASVVVNPHSYMTYQPFLPEAAAGSIEPRHVVAPHRRLLRGTTVLSGRVTHLDHGGRKATITPVEGESYDVSYDHVVRSEEHTSELQSRGHLVCRLLL